MSSTSEEQTGAEISRFFAEKILSLPEKIRLNAASASRRSPRR